VKEFPEQFEAVSIDALWVSTPENVRYLSGFSSPEDGRVLLWPDGSGLLFTDGRYTVQAAEESSLEVVIFSSQADLDQQLSRRLSGKRLGVEADHLTLQAARRLEGLSLQLKEVSGLIEERRRVKTPAEVERIRKAAELADRALESALPTLQVGTRELDFAFAVEAALRRLGANGVAFDFIVASGPRSAMPHGRASERQVEEGDLVTVDMGALYQGYHSDMTRAYPLGQLGSRLRSLYQEVLRVEQLAVEAVRPGVTGGELDQLAREALGRAGLAEAFAHSLGHGVGLAIHEGPRLAKGSQDRLEPGMVVTIEPGVYFPGFGGVRIEDLLLVTESGHSVLSHAAKAEL
jgi:Xaa-Pro aminopeptidase/Xaa-Pro dipeptidase